MKAVRVGLAIVATAAALAFGGGQAVAQDNVEACAELDAQQAVLDAQAAQFEASIAADRAQLDAIEAQYTLLYDSLIAAYANDPEIAAQYESAKAGMLALLANARAAYDVGEANFYAGVAASQASLDAGYALYDCD